MSVKRLVRLCFWINMLLAAARLEAAEKLDKVIADYGGLSGFQSASWVAKDLRLFEKHGLDAELVMITGGARSVATLLSGSTQFATGSATTPLFAAARGSDLRVLGASYNKFPYSFVVKPDIRSPKELRGRKVGILNFGGSNDLALQLAFKEWGIKLNEVTILLGGDAPTRLQSLIAGRIDAAILSPPHLTRAIQTGHRVLADMGEMTANFPQSSLYVKGSLIKENRDQVKRFVRAYAEAVHVIRTDKARTQRVFSQRMRMDDKEMLNTTYDYFAPRFSFPPRINMAGVRDTYSFYAEKDADLRGKTGEEFIDNSFMDELEKEGFFKKLGG